MSESSAVQFKDEGNALFGKGDYLGAYEKYTRGIAKDGRNAVLYANRAACCLNMERYLDATSDARKATEIDKGYSKAWARLATARTKLGEFPQCIHAWETALATLPKDNLKPGELEQKKQCAEGLKGAKKAFEDSLKAPAQHLKAVLGFDRNSAWERAKAMSTELERRGPEMGDSSAWVILGAYNEFSVGVKSMKTLKKVKTGKYVTYSGTPNVLDSLVNGILRDDRVFHMDDTKWLQYLNDSMDFESKRVLAWRAEGPQEMIEEAQKRLRELGWDAVRPALSKAIRIWLIRGYIDSNMRHDFKLAVEFFGRALEILDWGRQEWADVPESDRGVIFSHTFTRGVRSMYLEFLMKAWEPGKGTKESLKSLLQVANQIIRDLEVNPLVLHQPVDPGFISSFSKYPRGRALAVKGYYYTQLLVLENPQSLQERERYYRQAAKFYLDAANTFPVDDEYHVWFLKCSLDNLWLCGTPLKTTLPILERVRLAIPKMKRIWERSTGVSNSRDEALQRMVWLEEDLLKDIQSGKHTLESKVMPLNP